jgi:iron complex outermembrane receptor protein
MNGWQSKSIRRFLSAALLIGVSLFGTSALWGAESDPVQQQAQSETKTKMAQKNACDKDVPVAEVVVNAPREMKKKVKKVANIVAPSSTPVGTQTTVPRSVIDITAGPAQISPLSAISLQPGVYVEAMDPWGINIDYRIRGISGNDYGTIGETIDGVPLKGIGPGGNLNTIIDLENLGAINLLEGPIPADTGFGFATATGIIDLRMREPSDQAGATLSQTFGQDYFTKTFLRMDTGNIDNVAKAFFSASYTNADKWNGDGYVGVNPGGRENFEFGATSWNSDQKVTWALYGIYNKEEDFTYRGLNYQQTLDLNKYYGFDWNSALTGNSVTDANFFGYNYSDLQDVGFFGHVTLHLNDKSSITVTPYFLNDSGYTYTGTTVGSGTAQKGDVLDWILDHSTYGGICEYKYDITNGEIKAGYWHGESEPPGPPTEQQLLSIPTLQFVGWKTLQDVGNHQFNATYINVDKTFGPLTINSGVKELFWTQPNLTTYNGNGLPNLSYSQAIAMNPPSQSVHGTTYDLFLPDIGATYKLYDTTSIRVSFGRNYETPDYSLGGQFPTLLQKGFNAQQFQAMWDNLRPETSNNVDVGAVYDDGRLMLAPTFFFGSYNHVGEQYYDPNLGLSFNQNNEQATSYGFEAAAGYKFTPDFDTSLSFTYNNFYFTKNFMSSSKSTINATGKQLPDVPQFMGHLSADWRVYGITVTPIISYLGERYEDVQNKYSVGSSVVVDLMARKTFKLRNNSTLTLALGVSNLLDTNYISIIQASNTSIGENTPTYFVGPPRTIWTSATIHF